MKAELDAERKRREDAEREAKVARETVQRMEDQKAEKARKKQEAAAAAKKKEDEAAAAKKKEEDKQRRAQAAQTLR